MHRGKIPKNFVIGEQNTRKALGSGSLTLLTTETLRHCRFLTILCLPCTLQNTHCSLPFYEAAAACFVPALRRPLCHETAPNTTNQN